MDFEYLLNALLGARKILHAMECEICGYDEVYYTDPVTGKQIGRACEGCQFVQKFDF
ncbi:acyltransferase [Niallia oryzisoli]|uniref:Acyltransferase n=1 Tax=Niallia oryzisoli TaxID=1737571 RepID=A0ABZ2CIK8_9BACI